MFEDRANGYAIGDYKQRPNMIGMYETVKYREEKSFNKLADLFKKEQQFYFERCKYFI